MSSAVVTGAGSALPATLDQDAVWDGYFARHYEGVRAARRIFAGAGVRRRHAVASPLDEDLSGWGTGARMERYVQEALPLGKQAVAGALDAAGLAPGDVGLFAVATCTGLRHPGPGHPAGQRPRHAAGPAAAAGRPHGLLRRDPGAGRGQRLRHRPVAPGRAALLRADQPARPAGAAPTSSRSSRTRCSPTPRRRSSSSPAPRRGRRVAGVVARTDPSTADHMTWDVTDLGFRMGLSPRVPDVLVPARRRRRRRAAGRGRAADRGRRRLGGAPGRAAHPRRRPRRARAGRGADGGLPPGAGRARQLLVGDRAARAARSSADVDGPVVAMAFGPGLTLYAALLLPA